MRAQVLTLCGPIQREIHSLIASYFTKEKTEALRPVLERFVNDVLVDVEGVPEWDVVSAIGKRVPMLTVAYLLGLPSAICPKLVEWTDIVECVARCPRCLFESDSAGGFFSQGMVRGLR
jgi:cytochrome P450